jgi:iron complex outermembrane receptor protein
VIHTTPTLRKATLLLGAAPFALVLGATPAFAQDASAAAPATVPPAQSVATAPVDQSAAAAQPAATAPAAQSVATAPADQSAAAAPTAQVADAAPADQGAAAAPTAQVADATPPADIVVTGTLFRNAAAATASPVTVLTATDLANRGINTVSDALQSLPQNNGGTLNTNWSPFGFATGASAPSLRGLDDGRTLTLFDGMRSAVYPLADDGYRNFVDINTIPDSIVDRVEVLADGASSTYGADAVAGVVNVIIKKQITGLHLNASEGISQQGDAGEQRFDATYGYGKLDEQGFNVYVNGEYQNDDPLMLGARGAPYGTANHSNICGTSLGSTDKNGNVVVPAGSTTCMPNGIRNGIQADGSYGGFQSTTVPFVRPADGSGPWQMLNPAAGCGSLPSVTLTGTQRASNSLNPATVCQQDLTNQYYEYSPRIQRLGANMRATVNVGSRAQAYAMFNFYQTRTWNTGTPESFAGLTAAGGTQVAVSPLLPVYVCPRGTTVACSATNGTLNPQNPFAAQGQQALLSGLYQPTEVDTDARTFRYSAGINGSFGDGWNYNFDATHSEVDLTTTDRNYILAQNLLNVIADGSYNFANPSANSAAENQYLSPNVTTNSKSLMTQVQGTLAHSFYQLPGGPLQVAVGASWRRESVNDPSSNPENNANPYDRYYGINAVGVVGSRDVRSAFYEIDAPVLTNLELKTSGRYDNYSSGQSNFSPKFEAQFSPIKQIKLRGTFTKGFTIPSFNEAYGFPTTGYVSSTATNPTYLAAHNYNAYATQPYEYGLTTTSNPNLQPETTTQYTLGAVLQPTKFLTFTLDYYHIKINNLIIAADCSAAVANYYTGVSTPGCTTTAGVPDQNFPNAMPQLGTVTSSYINADSEISKGLDFTGTARIPLGHGIRWTSTVNASYLMYLGVDMGGVEQRYDGSLSPCNISSCSGSPKWRGNWQNTLDFNGKASLSATVNYTSGYSLESTDIGGIAGNCLGSIGASVVTYSDGVTPVSCRAGSFVDVDMTASVKIADKFTLYTNVLNLFNAAPPFDPSAAYSLYQFNPAWGGAGFIGRYFRVGVKIDI